MAPWNLCFKQWPDFPESLAVDTKKKGGWPLRHRRRAASGSNHFVAEEHSQSHPQTHSSGGVGYQLGAPERKRTSGSSRRGSGSGAARLRR
eukprot:706328-Hanusia_phi.AAC.1